MTSSAIYTDTRVSKSALSEFFKKFAPEQNEVHTLQIIHNGKTVVRIAPAPYSPTDKREIYSLSKSFCSTAIGFLCDESKLSTEDRVVDLFPDKLPATVSENLSKMRVKHVLSMNTGHACCVMPQMERSGDAARTFLEQEVTYEPGTHFTYNTGATCLLACIVERASGMSLLDFLTIKLFLPLGITGAKWNPVLDGTSEGGCGLHVCSDDIAKLGLLYINGGVWNGKRLLSEEWVKTATSPISDNSMNGSPDWCSGYGYQFWVNSREGFRGDGAYGQLCVVLPRHDMVFALQTELYDMQGEMDAIMDLADHLFDEDDADSVILPSYEAASSEQKCAGFENTFFRFDENPMGFTSVHFIYDSDLDEMKAVFSDGVDHQTLRAGNGHWVESTIYAKKLKPKLVDIMSTPFKEHCRTAASYSAQDGKITFKIRYLNCPHRMLYTFVSDGDTLTVQLENSALLDSDASRLSASKC